jgi:predicted acyltransferase
VNVNKTVKNIGLSVGITLIIIAFVWAGTSILLPGLIGPVAVFAGGVDLLFLAAIWGEGRGEGQESSE